jgi:hypothetical protein
VRNIRVGNGCGFWGDSLEAPLRLVERGQLDYLTLEYLAELTLSIMAHQRRRDPATGYATDFIEVLRRLAPQLKRQPNLRIVTNAGGVNPSACARAARKCLADAGLPDCRIALVTGDDLAQRLAELLRAGHTFQHLDTGEPLEPLLDRVVSANAYLGARPIAEALAQRASIVITGRVADASLTVGPAAHEFGWAWDDWPRIAGATVAGHLIECGAQVTGGLYCHWQAVPDYAHIGYPIAVIAEDGSFSITKPMGTGGVVNRETVIEQLLYEIGDPADYLTPDVRADFTSVKVEEAGQQVRVSGASGRAPTDAYKVSVAYRDGHMASGTLAIYGADAADKARACGQIVLDRLGAVGRAPARSRIELIGDGDPSAARMLLLRVAVHDSDRDLVERFCREFSPLVTSGPPGVTGYTGARPRPHEVLAYWPSTVARSVVEPAVQLV